MERQRPTPRRGSRADRPGPSVARSEEQATVEAETRERGRAQVRKRIESAPAERAVPRHVERAEIERAGPNDEDSGEIETLPDGSLSVPVLEEEIVVTKRLVVRERVIVRKRVETVTETVTADLRRERVEVTGDVSDDPTTADADALSGKSPGP